MGLEGALETYNDAEPTAPEISMLPIPSSGEGSVKLFERFMERGLGVRRDPGFS